MAIQTFHVGIKAAIVRNSTILALKSTAHGYWDLPGGRIDDDESIEQTLRREIMEEIGVSQGVQIGKIVCAIRVANAKLKEGGGLVLIAYNVIIPEDAKMKLSDEHSELQWLSFEDAQRHGGDLLQEVVKQLS